MTSKIVKNDFTKLNNFVRAISEKWIVKVGVFGSKTNRKEGVLTNAELGAIHEFGNSKIPARSFLRVPLFLKTAEILVVASSGILEHLANGKAREILVDLGHACEVVVLQAFDTAGFGNWKPLSYSTLMSRARRGAGGRRDVWQRKQVVAETMHEGGEGGQPLVDTGQLRRAIASKVERRG